MITEKTHCPKCSGEMVLGFTGWSHGGTRCVSSWEEGAPEKSFWWGTKNSPKEKQVPVGTFRCSACGFLESYARPEFDAR
jgi:hypothetical protein